MSAPSSNASEAPSLRSNTSFRRYLLGSAIANGTCRPGRIKPSCCVSYNNTRMHQGCFPWLKSVSTFDPPPVLCLVHLACRTAPQSSCLILLRLYRAPRSLGCSSTSYCMELFCRRRIIISVHLRGIRDGSKYISPY